MGNFIVVTGVGHAATKWLATVMHHPDQNVVFYHEPLMHLKRGRWMRARHLEMDEDAECPSDYRAFIENNLRSHRVVGDVISWLPLATVTVLKKWFDVRRVIFLVRHGIPQLHSIATKSLMNRHGTDSFLYAKYVRRYWELAGSPGKDWPKWTRWEMMCLWWSTNAFMPDLAAKHVPTEIHCMEDLTQDIEYLIGFCRVINLHTETPKLKELQSYNVDRPDLERLQGQDINRKVPGDRTPEFLWSKWTREQQDAFRRICGPGMEKFGYDMP